MTQYTAHQPRDDMERSIVRQLIEANLKTWPMDAALRDETEPGVWEFSAYLPQSNSPVDLRDIDSLVTPSVRGIVYVTDDERRAEPRALVQWELPEQDHCFAQSNSGDWAPVLR